MNRATISGNLTRDPELRTTQSGLSVCSFSVAVRRRVKNASGEYDTDFINCVAWRQTAEYLCRYAHKGDRVIVSGALQTRQFDAQDGSKRYVTEIVADEAECLTRQFGTPSNTPPAFQTDARPLQPQAEQMGFTEIEDDSGLPF